MAEISVIGGSSAGGLIVGPGAVGWSVDGKTISVKGDAVAGHGQSPHAAPTMIEGSKWMSIDGVEVVVSGCLASCGHVADGVPWFTLPK